MQFCMSGLGPYADTLVVESLATYPYDRVTSILNIAGVKYYAIQTGTLRVGYTSPTDVKDVAAQVLGILARVADVPLTDVELLVSERSLSEIDELGYADDIWRRASTIALPEDVELARVHVSGASPVYWLRTR